tara:strand:- start:1442 stop:2053 length:612 start_codon:yes stop_codon:yes gene_type:complete
LSDTGYYTYINYLALQRHFTSDYDYFKYQGKVNASKTAYNNRTDHYSFEKLSKILPQKELENFFVSHFISKPNCWIKDMSKDNYEKYKSHLKKFPQKFKQDVEMMSVEYTPFKLIEVKSDTSIPLIHELVIKKIINIETLILMDNFFPFVDNHFKSISIPIMWPDHIKKVKNYLPFVKKILNIPYYNDIALGIFKANNSETRN